MWPYNKLEQNKFCIPESINTNISHHVFDYKMTFVNSLHDYQIQKVICTQKPVVKILFKDFWYTKINWS